MAGLIPQSFIDELIARADIVELVGRRLRLKRQGREFSALCPFHEEKSPSFTVSPQKQFFHCFGCGAHGTALGFLMRYENLDFVQAVEHLAADLGLEVPHEGGAKTRPHTPLYEALGRAQAFFGTELSRSARAQEYLRRRGLTAPAVETWGIGYAPTDGTALLAALRGAGVDEAVLVAAGLIARNTRGSYDRFRDRLMLPIRDSRGRVTGFGGRTIGEGKPKYLNSPETPVFHKGRMLYGLYEARRQQAGIERLVVVEGYLDVIALAGAGFRGAVATLGTAVSEAQMELLFRSGADEVIFCFDGDAAGERAAWRALEQSLPAVAPGRVLRFGFLPAGEDPDSLVRHDGLEAFEKILTAAQPLSVFLLDRLAAGGLDGAEGRARFAGALRPLLGRVRDELFRDALLTEAAGRLQMAPERLTRLLLPPRRPAIAAASTSAGFRPAISIDPRVARALSLALALPGRVASEGWPESIAALALPGAALLAEVVETLRTDPHLTTAGVLEHWRDRPEASLLGRLASRDPLIDGDEALAAEYRKVLADLVRTGREAEIRQLREAATLRDLDQTERERLRRLLGKEEA
ncbi:MAG TPA: DNA primase [Gammaproteobacteria bacterium]|nr:DNA primase [Gammaproteobacteria bacterium]